VTPLPASTVECSDFVLVRRPCEASGIG
jgi:hypothetical protein